MHFILLVWIKWHKLCCLNRASLQMSVISSHHHMWGFKRGSWWTIWWGKSELFASSTTSRRCPSKLTTTYLPPREQPASDKGSTRQEPCVEGGGVEERSRTKEREKGEKRHRGSGKGQRHGGVSSHCQNKESVYTNCLPDKTLETSEISQQAAL